MVISNIQKDAGRSWTYALDAAFVGVSARQVVSSFRSVRPRTLPWLTLGCSTLLLARHLWEDRTKVSKFSVSTATKDLWEGARFVTKTLLSTRRKNVCLLQHVFCRKPPPTFYNAKIVVKSRPACLFQDFKI